LTADPTGFDIRKRKYEKAPDEQCSDEENAEYQGQRLCVNQEHNPPTVQPVRNPANVPFEFGACLAWAAQAPRRCAALHDDAEIEGQRRQKLQVFVFLKFKKVKKQSFKIILFLVVIHFVKNI
jgi:hypothetical protein